VDWWLQNFCSTGTCPPPQETSSTIDVFRRRLTSTPSALSYLYSLCLTTSALSYLCSLCLVLPLLSLPCLSSTLSACLSLYLSVSLPAYLSAFSLSAVCLATVCLSASSLSALCCLASVQVTTSTVNLTWRQSPHVTNESSIIRVQSVSRDVTYRSRHKCLSFFLSESRYQKMKEKNMKNHKR